MQKYFSKQDDPSLTLLTIGLVVMGAFNLDAQSFYRYRRSGELNVYAATGLTKYFGELSDDKNLGDVNPFLSLGVNLPLRSRWSFRPEFTYYRISAADGDLAVSDSRHGRNLSFRSDNLELSGIVTYSLHAKDQRHKISKIRPYLLAGLGITYFNPKAQFEGQWHKLQPLHTEGVDYKKFHLVVPMGFGVGLRVNPQWQLALEMAYRLTFTDYLDDVSTWYRDPASFSDPLAAALADRRPEIGLDKAPAGSPRGNSRANDGYLLFGVKVFYQLPGSGPLRRIVK